MGNTTVNPIFIGHSRAASSSPGGPLFATFNGSRIASTTKNSGRLAAARSFLIAKA
jgi:hypothetical protein